MADGSMISGRPFQNRGQSSDSPGDSLPNPNLGYRYDIFGAIYTHRWGEWRLANFDPLLVAIRVLDGGPAGDGGGFRDFWAGLQRSRPSRRLARIPSFCILSAAKDTVFCAPRTRTPGERELIKFYPFLAVIRFWMVGPGNGAWGSMISG